MYNIKGPSKIVAKTARRGVPQNRENFREFTKSKEYEVDEALNGPKPTFQSTSKKSHQQRHRSSEILVTPQHEEIIKYIYESWNLVCSEIAEHTAESRYNNNGKEKQTILYYEDDPCPLLQNFKPFDLEAWWGRRLYTYITSSVNSNS